MILEAMERAAKLKEKRKRAKNNWHHIQKQSKEPDSVGRNEMDGSKKMESDDLDDLAKKEQSS